jgi:hypothetical protein
LFPVMATWAGKHRIEVALFVGECEHLVACM